MKKLLVVALLGIIPVITNAQIKKVSFDNKSTFASNLSIQDKLVQKTEVEYLNTAMNTEYYNSGPRPGDELVKFSRNYYIGLGLISGGAFLQIATAFATINANNPNNPSYAYIYLLGAGMQIGGTISILESFSHIGKAGRMMNELDDQYEGEMERRKESSFKLNSSQDGLGMAYNF